MGNNKQFKYDRVLLKISGESLGSSNSIFHEHQINLICSQIQSLNRAGVEVSVVIGAGNIWRGREAILNFNISRISADYLGMVATIMNGIMLEAKLKLLGVDVILLSSLEINKVAEPFYYKKALSHLSKKRVVIFFWRHW